MQRKPRRFFLMIIAFAVFVVPAVVSAADGFTDVADTSVFKANIDWLAAAGVTKGCNPPANDKFCPEDNVTRQQMAAFLNRLAINKVVDAATAVEADKLDGKDSTDFLGKTAKATDSDKLDGKDSTDFLGKTEQAADSAELEGKTAAELSSLAGSAVVDAVVFPGSGSAPFRLGSLTGFDVPASGGVITATATGSAVRNGGNQLGVLWIEIDGTGACDIAPIPFGSGIWETVTTLFGDLGASNAVEVAAGTHRIDLCTGGLGADSTTMTARLNVVWSETASGAGVASSSGGQSWQELLAPYEGLLDN